MSDLNRRGAMLAMASGAAATATLLTTGKGEASMQESRSDQKTDAAGAIEKQIKAVAALAGPFPATVGMARSWDHHVYLVLDNGVRGYAPLDPPGHGIAAACQAAGRKVFMKYTSHDPNWGNSAGYFQGVTVALDQGVFPA